MKLLSYFSALIIIIVSVFACGGNSGNRKMADGSAADTAYTGPDSIVKYFSNEKLLKEVTFKDGKRNGLTRTFYPGGQLYQTFIYKNDLREDSSGWYYLEGQLFRSTPYRHDTIQGIQRQYYRDGKKRARIGYDKGLRTELFQEFTKDGKLVKSYPDILVDVKDDYRKSGKVTLTLSLSDNGQKVRFYKGELAEGKYDTAKYDAIRVVNGKGTLVMKKSGTGGSKSVGIIGDITTSFGNRYLTWKKIELPYDDLK